MVWHQRPPQQIETVNHLHHLRFMDRGLKLFFIINSCLTRNIFMLYFAWLTERSYLLFGQQESQTDLLLQFLQGWDRFFQGIVSEVWLEFPGLRLQLGYRCWTTVSNILKQSISLSLRKQFSFFYDANLDKTCFYAKIVDIKMYAYEWEQKSRRPILKINPNESTWQKRNSTFHFVFWFCNHYWPGSGRLSVKERNRKPVIL